VPRPHLSHHDGRGARHPGERVHVLARADTLGLALYGDADGDCAAAIHMEAQGTEFTKLFIRISLHVSTTFFGTLHLNLF
jgi:hypothetical protein